MSVALYKRAQILVGDIWACCGGTGFGAFSDIDAITAFADYRVPQLLVWFDVLQYSDSLQHTLHSGKHLLLLRWITAHDSMIHMHSICSCIASTFRRQCR